LKNADVVFKDLEEFQKFSRDGHSAFGGLVGERGVPRQERGNEETERYKQF